MEDTSMISDGEGDTQIDVSRSSDDRMEDGNTGTISSIFKGFMYDDQYTGGAAGGGNENVANNLSTSDRDTSFKCMAANMAPYALSRSDSYQESMGDCCLDGDPTSSSSSSYGTMASASKKHPQTLVAASPETPAKKKKEALSESSSSSSSSSSALLFGGERFQAGNAANSGRSAAGSLSLSLAAGIGSSLGLGFVKTVTTADLGSIGIGIGAGASASGASQSQSESQSQSQSQSQRPRLDSGNTPTSDRRFLTDFHVNKVIGSGTFGSVQCVTHKVSGVQYAVKRSKRRFISKSDRHAMLKEVETMAELSAASDDEDMSHIVRYYAGWIEADDHVYLQMELCEGGSVEAMLNQHTARIETKEMYRILRHVFLGLKFIHSNGLVHLDIKPGNILKKHSNYKIADFGLALHTNKGRASTSGSVEEGDSRYLAKEMLDWEPVADLTKCDIFAVGVMAFELASCAPVPAQGEGWHTLRNNHWVAPLGASSELVEILSACMHSDPKHRPTSVECLQSHTCLMSDIEKELRFQKLRVEALEAELLSKKDGKSKSVGDSKGPPLRRHHSII